MRRIHRHHRRWHRRHDFRLQRALFWWFGITILMTSLVSFGVMRLVSPDMHSWRRDADRLQHFAADRFAKVWDDPPARLELASAVSQAFDAAIRVEDVNGRVLDRVGGECQKDAVTIDVTRDGRALGSVHGCLHEYRTHWTGVLVTLFAAFLTIWPPPPSFRIDSRAPCKT